MKKIISTLSFILFMGFLAVSVQSCNNGGSGNTEETFDESQMIGDVYVYYFHSTRRCATCEAVEEVTKEAIKDYTDDEVSFRSINIEEEENEKLVEKYEISGQTLLVINDGNKVDLTSDAFLNARTDPSKLKNLLKSTINKLL